MGALNLRLPESLHAGVREFSALENISINQLITTAIAEKLAAIGTETYLK